MKTVLKKRYGQHFLRDTAVLQRLAGFIAPSPGDLFVEVGAGAGALSARLAPAVSGLLAVEIDRDLLEGLRETLAPFPNARAVGGDVLSLDLVELISPYLQPGISLRIAGNLPYNIGTAIIERFLPFPLRIADLVFVLQLEMARRMAAVPGSKDYGYFSVFCQHFCEVRTGFRIAPHSFEPPPKVHSAVVRLQPRPESRDSAADAAFIACAKASFSHRRKKLANSLRHVDPFKSLAGAMLERAGIDGGRRAEELSLQEHERLAAAYRSLLQGADGEIHVPPAR